MADGINESEEQLEAVDACEDNIEDPDLIFVGEERGECEEGIEGGEETYDTTQQSETTRNKTGDRKEAGDENLMVVDEWGEEEDDEFELDEEEDHMTGEGEVNGVDDDPEENERALLHMPSTRTVLDDVGHLKKDRRVSVYPLTMNELSHPKVLDTISSDCCEELKLHFVRPKTDTKAWSGYVVMAFSSSRAAKQAFEDMKSLRDDLTVKSEDQSETSMRAMEQFAKDEKGHKVWTDTLLVAMNVPDDATVDQLKECFPDAEDIIIHNYSSKRRDSSAAKTSSATAVSGDAAAGTPSAPATTSRPAATGSRGFAYIVYRTADVAQEMAQLYASDRPSLSGQRIRVYPYRPPIDNIPRGYLRLGERRVIMKYMSKLAVNLEKAKEDPSATNVDLKTKRYEACKSLIERDDRARKSISLPQPTVEEMLTMKNLPLMGPKPYHETLIKYGVITEVKDKRKSSGAQERGGKTKGEGGKERSGRGGYRRDGGSPRDSGRGGRDQKNSRDYGGSKRRGYPSGGSRYSGRGGGSSSRGGINSVMGAGLVNPLALMMQQNMGMMGAGNMGGLGMMMQPNMLGAAGMMGGLGQPNQMAMMAGMGGGGMDRDGKMLRLDETGNYRSSGSRYNQGDRSGGRYYGGQRSRSRDRQYHDDGGMSRDRRSRSPDRGRRGGVGPSDTYMAAPESGRKGKDGEMANPVHLLLNLSQMLSQKMEQRDRDQRGGYDRDDYRMGPR